jgi:hypothetical protein
MVGNVTELDESGVQLKNPLAIMWIERFAVMQQTSNEMAAGETSRSVSTRREGMLMPAFSFEKISPPARAAAATPTPKKQRGLIDQVLDRIAGARGKRSPQKDPPAPSAQQNKKR